MKYHLAAIRHIKSDGRTVVYKHAKQLRSVGVTSCGMQSHRTRASMGTFEIGAFMEKCKNDKLDIEAGFESSVCQKCRARLKNLIEEGQKIRSKA
jgi:hypothetical protein